MNSQTRQCYILKIKKLKKNKAIKLSTITKSGYTFYEVVKAENIPT